MHTEWSDLEPECDSSRRWFALEVLLAAIPVGLGVLGMTIFAVTFLLGA